MQFGATTSLVPKTVKRTDRKQVVRKHVGTRRLTQECGSCGRAGALFGAGTVFVQTHEPCLRTSVSSCKTHRLYFAPQQRLF